MESVESRTYIILDAFDECVNNARRELVQLLLSANDRVYLFIASCPNRSVDEIEASSRHDARIVNVVAGVRVQSQDLKCYLDRKLAREPQKKEPLFPKEFSKRLKACTLILTCSFSNLLKDSY